MDNTSGIEKTSEAEKSSDDRKDNGSTKPSNVIGGRIQKVDSRVFIYIIAFVLFVLQLILYLRGIGTEWYNDLDIADANLDLNPILWTIAYLSSLVGYGWIIYKYPKVNIEFVISLTVIGIALSVIWDIVFFYVEDILLSVLVQILGCLLYGWLLYVLVLISPVAAFLHVPIVVFSYYQLYLNVKLFMANPERSVLRPLTRVSVFD